MQMMYAFWHWACIIFSRILIYSERRARWDVNETRLL